MKSLLGGIATIARRGGRQVPSRLVVGMSQGGLAKPSRAAPRAYLPCTHHNLLRWSSTSSRIRSSSSSAITPAVVPPSDATPDRAAMRPPTFTRPQILTKEDGNQLLLFDMRPHPRLKPSLVASRRKKMRTYIGQEKGIRGSPWRLNLVCQFVAGLTLNEALLQLQFSKKGKAPLVQKVLKRTSNLADIRDGLQMSQLEVAECFATKGTPLKRLKIMAKGRFGRLEHRFAHFRVVLREIDFPLKIYQARTAAQKKKWFLRQQEAEADYARAAAERAEVQRLERETAQHATTS